MKPISNIWIIAKYELKTLSRSWFFRIFAFIGVFIIIAFNLIMLLADGPRWNVRAIASVIPYFNMIFLSIAQAIIIAFLSTEFLKSDKKLDTSEVIYIRSISNGEYVLGKTLGTLLIFLLLNVFIMTVTAIINIAMDEVGVDLLAYILYPLIIGLPSLIFITGLAYLSMIILRNQAVTFVVLLGYMAVVLFYLNDNFNYSFNFLANMLPAFKSEIVGFSNLWDLLQHRLIYLSFGLGLIFLTVLLLSRLRQSTGMTRFSMLMTIIGFSCGTYLLINRINYDLKLQELWRQNRATEARFIELPTADILSMKLNLKHHPDQIEVNSAIMLKTQQKLDSFYFQLNPGLEISNLSLNDEHTRFSRTSSIVTVHHTLEEGQDIKMIVEYKGIIEEYSMYSDIDEEVRQTKNRLTIYSIGKDYNYIQPHFILLTQEADWYPQTRIAFSKDAGKMTPVQFIEFELEVSTLPQLTAISQGKRTEKSKGHFHFKPEQPLPQISLAIGEYKEVSIVIDSVEYSLRLHKDHFYFNDYFTNLQDTLPDLIRDLKNDFERELNIEYPYKRFSIVEVPAQYVSFPRLYTVATEVMQPEMSFFPEKGIILRLADFQFRKEWMEKDNDRNGGEMTDLEIETNLFKGFVTGTLTRNDGGNFFSNDNPSEIFRRSYSIFPNYFSFTNFVYSDHWVFFNKSIEGYLWDKVSPKRESRFFEAITDGERANLARKEKSLDEIIADNNWEIAEQAILNQGNHMLSLIKKKTGDSGFENALAKLIVDHKFHKLNVDQLSRYFTLQDSGSVEMLINESIDMSALPAFVISDERLKKFVDNDREKYIVSFKVENTGGSEGIIETSFPAGGRGGGGGFPFRGFEPDQADEEGIPSRLIAIQKNEKLLVSVILDEEPRRMEVKTFVSENLPSSLSFQFQEPETIKYVPEEQIVVLDTSTGNIQEIIIDNEDEGFYTTAGNADTPLRALIKGEADDSDEKYKAIRWRSPNVWTPSINTTFYGDHIRSAHFIHSGDGSEKASWKTDLPEAEYYEVWAYISFRENRWSRREDASEVYHFIVHADDGAEEIEISVKDSNPGWNNLGTYYFSDGEAKIELTNESPGNTVIADAVKWVKM